MSIRLSLLAILTICILSTIYAQPFYSGVFKSTADSLEYSFGLSWEQLKSAQQSQRAKGFELDDVEATLVEKKRQYHAIWRAGAPARKLALVPAWDSLVMIKRIMAADSFLMHDIEAFTHKEVAHFVVLWQAGTTKHKVRKLSSWEGLMNDYEEMNRRGLHVVDIEGFTAADGETHYLALYHKRIASRRTHLHRAADIEAFNVDKRKRNKSGYQLFDYEHFEKRGVEFHFGIYEKAQDRGAIVEADTMEEFEAEMARLAKEQQLKLTDLDVYAAETER